MSASVDDHSRVILDKVEGDVDSDYINASYIDVGSINQSISITTVLVALTQAHGISIPESVSQSRRLYIDIDWSP